LVNRDRGLSSIPRLIACNALTKGRQRQRIEPNKIRPAQARSLEPAFLVVSMVAEQKKGNSAAIYYLRLDFFLCERLLAFFFGERLAFFALVFFLAAISVAPRTTSTACGQKSGNSLGCSGSGH
jgi:hypothetical protein